MNILKVLCEGERNVGELCHDLGDMNQPAVSHHLALLRVGHLVESRRAGKHVYYSLTSRGRGLIQNLAKVVP
jgi:DNA-binding transcriptional ArsR family regulator